MIPIASSRPVGGEKPGKARTIIKRERRKRLGAMTLGLLASSLLLATPVLAETELPFVSSPLWVSGFMTLGLSRNDNAQAGVVSSSVQKHPLNKGWGGTLDTVAGLQLNWQPINGTSFVLQGVARAGDGFEPHLRLATVRQQLGAPLAVRLGRIRSPLFLDSDVTEIGYAYLSVRPPLPLYASLNSVAHIDGGDIQWRTSLGDANLLVQGFAGKSEYRHRFYSYEPIMIAQAKLNDVLGLAVSVTTPNWTARASHTAVGKYTMRADHLDRLNAGSAMLAQGVSLMALDPRLPPPLAAGLRQQAASIDRYQKAFDGKPTYSSLGFDGSFSDWRVLAEVTHFKSHSEAIGDYAGWQLTVGRNFGDFTPYIGGSGYRRLSPLLDTSALAPTGLDPRLDAALLQARGELDHAARYADISMRALTLGVRWDLRQDMALKLQYDRLRTPSDNVAGYFTVRELPIRRHINLLSVTLDLVF